MAEYFFISGSWVIKSAADVVLFTSTLFWVIEQHFLYWQEFVGLNSETLESLKKKKTFPWSGDSWLLCSLLRFLSLPGVPRQVWPHCKRFGSWACRVCNGKTRWEFKISHSVKQELVRVGFFCLFFLRLWSSETPTKGIRATAKGKKIITERRFFHFEIEVWIQRFYGFNTDNW